MAVTLRVSVVVPTLGRSPLLADCLRALRREARIGTGTGGPIGLILVAQGEVAAPEGWGERSGEALVRVPEPLGFAGAVNLGVAVASAPYVAVVNDDAVVEPGWLAALASALDRDPGAAAAQGVNLIGSPALPAARPAAEPPRIDGRGLAWNRWLQAVQLGHGEVDRPRRAGSAQGTDSTDQGRAPAAEACEVFGVSATAALYRRDALLAVARPPRSPAAAAGPAPPAEVFDSRLGSYYEDVDLALRLRVAGHRALSVPAARAWHAGSQTAGAGVGRWRQVHGNRYLVAARLLGRSFWRSLPRMLLRDVADLAAALAAGELRRAAGIAAGWGRAARHLHAFARTGPARLSADALVATAPRAGEAL